MHYISTEKEPQRTSHFYSVDYQAAKEELLQTDFMMLVTGW